MANPAQRRMRPQSHINNPDQFSANYKIADVAKRMGIQDLSKMQITTRQIYDCQKIAVNPGQQTFTFFADVNTKKFPLTNLNENKLQAGEAIAVERSYLSVVRTVAGSPVQIIDVYPVEFFNQFRPFVRGDFDFQIDRQTVTKKINTTSWYAPFNKDANFGAITNLPAPTNLVAYGQSVYHLDNSFVIIPQIEFTCTLQVPAILALPEPADDWYLMLNLEGLGCLFNPKGNY